MTSPSMTDMLKVFGRIGIYSFGGPAAQIAVMHKELVEDRPWLSEDGFLRALSFCMLLPGPEAMQLATYAGWRMRGVAGGLLAGLLFVLPGALVIAALVGLYASFGQVPGVQAAFLGIKAAVVIIVLQALRKLAGKALHGPDAWLLAAVGFTAIFAFNIPFPLIVLAAGIYGFAKGGHSAEPAELTAKGKAHKPVRKLLVWGGLWLLPLIGLTLAGWEFLSDIGWFFAKLAVVTFGGAYAVLAYMSQTVVQHYQWIEAGQMIDALGLAETTPGPLILVTQFVAMLSGLQSGGAALGLAAGAVALWATFMPCFLWIFLAAPYVEQITSHPRLGAALKAITASVAGVILNLSVWFALHVLFGKVGTLEIGPASLAVPEAGTLNIAAVVLTALAAALMLGLRWGMGRCLLAMAAAGLALGYLPAMA